MAAPTNVTTNPAHARMSVDEVAPEPLPELDRQRTTVPKVLKVPD